MIYIQVASWPSELAQFWWHGHAAASRRVAEVDASRSNSLRRLVPSAPALNARPVNRSISATGAWNVLDAVTGPYEITASFRPSQIPPSSAHRSQFVL